MSFLVELSGSGVSLQSVENGCVLVVLNWTPDVEKRD